MRVWIASSMWKFIAYLDALLLSVHVLSCNADVAQGGRDGMGELIDYCQWETFNATCPPGHVIVMQAARYGRMRFGRCVKEDHGNPGCSADVLAQLDARCSGRPSCTVSVPDQELHAVHPCPKELMPYLQASYTCVDVHNTEANRCRSSGALSLADEHGFLALPPPSIGSVKGSLADSSANQLLTGTPLCPWLLTVARGRHINITLYNFGLTVQHLSPYLAISGDNRCQSTLVAEEADGRRREMALCNIRSRLTHVYISSSHALKVYFRFLQPSPSVESLRTNDPFPMIVKFRGTGCADVAEVHNAWVERQGDKTTVRCNFTGETFFLSCTGDGTWLGEVTNCSQAVASSISKVEFTPPAVKRERLPYGLFVVVGLGVAVGVATGLVLLFTILVLFKRRDHASPDTAARRRTYGHTVTCPPPSFTGGEGYYSAAQSYYVQRQQTGNDDSSLPLPPHPPTFCLPLSPERQLYDKCAQPPPLYTTCDCLLLARDSCRPGDDACTEYSQQQEDGTLWIRDDPHYQQQTASPVSSYYRADATKSVTSSSLQHQLPVSPTSLTSLPHSSDVNAAECSSSIDDHGHMTPISQPLSHALLSSSLATRDGRTASVASFKPPYEGAVVKPLRL